MLALILPKLGNISLSHTSWLNSTTDHLFMLQGLVDKNLAYSQIIGNERVACIPGLLIYTQSQYIDSKIGSTTCLPFGALSSFVRLNIA